ncbi:unnamed protein product [Ophioblennius macclurei]
MSADDWCSSGVDGSVQSCIDVHLADGAGGLISASRGHSHDSCHLLPEAAVQRRDATHSPSSAASWMLNVDRSRQRTPVIGFFLLLTDTSMVDNTSIATKSALQGSFSAGSLPPQAPASVAALSSFSAVHAPQTGGMKLEAVMENLQRQQAARLALEEKLRQAEKEKDLRSMVESQIQQQALAFRHYQAAMRGALAARVGTSSAGGALQHMEVRRGGCGESPETDGDSEEQDAMEEEEEEEEEEEDENDEGGRVGLKHYQRQQEAVSLMARVPVAFAPPRLTESPPGPQQQQHEWTYEEQFKQVGPSAVNEVRKDSIENNIYI